MGRLATHLAASVANVDNLPPTKQLEQISLWDAFLPKSCSQPQKKIPVRHETTVQPTQQRHVSSCLQPQWCDVRRDFKGRKIIVAHKGPCYGNGPSADGGDGKGGTEDVKKGANGNGGAKNGEKKGQNSGDAAGEKKSGGGGGEEAQEFTPEEDEKLKALKAEGKSWAQIVPELGGRSKKALQERWKIVNPENGGGNVSASNKNGGGGDGQKGEKGGNGGDKKRENGGGGGAAKNDNSNKDAANNNGEQQPKLTKAQKKAARKEAKDAGGGEPDKPTADDDNNNNNKNDAKPPPAGADKKKSARSYGGDEAHFTLDEWITLQEDEVFSFGELQLLSELIAQYDAGRWGMVASRFFDKTGRRVHADDVREKFMWVMG